MQTRWIKKATFIRKQLSTIDRDKGQLNVSHVLNVDNNEATLLPEMQLFSVKQQSTVVSTVYQFYNSTEKGSC